MSISTKTGKVTGKMIKGLLVAPKATGGKLKSIKQDLAAGYREVIPGKNKDA